MRETRTAVVELDDLGVLTVRIRNGMQQTLADAEQNLGAALLERGGQRRPLLIDIREGDALRAEVRHYYSGQVLVTGFTALALVVRATPLGRTIGNVYLRVAKPGIPTQLFSDISAAKEWLTAMQPA